MPREILSDQLLDELQSYVRELFSYLKARSRSFGKIFTALIEEK
jgi:hypothetical protein